MTPVPSLWLALGIVGGSTFLDSRFADYQWNVTPRPALGVQATAGAGRFAAGLRVLQSRSAQTIGIPDPASTASVHATSLELVGQGRLARFAGIELHATASGGRVHLGYHPDRVEATVGGTPVTVDFTPIDTWIGGGGLAATRALPGPWRAGLSIDRRWFSIDTAHRSGTTITTQGETFGDWNARLELSRLVFGMKGTS